MFVDSQAIEYFTNDVLLVKINAEEDTLTKQRYHVMGYPTTVLINKDGSEVDRLIGYAPPEEFIGTLVDYSNGIGTLADLLDSASTVDDRTLLFAIADKYKYRGEPDSADTWYNRVIAAGDAADSLSGASRVAMADQLLRMDDYGRALESFKAIAVDFEGQYHGMDAETYVGYIYRVTGDTAQALAKFKEVAEKYPGTEAGDYAASQVEKLSAPPEATE